MHVVIDGLLTHYETFGTKTKPTILILHGWKRSITEWVPLAKQLEKNYHVLLLDLPGFGQTTQAQKDFSIYEYAHFVEAFLDKLEIEKVLVIGHSFGGRIGIILAAKTDRVLKLILVDAAGVEKRSFIATCKIFFFKTVKVFLPQTTVVWLRSVLGSPDYKSAGTLRTTFLKVINEDLSYLLSKVSASTYIIWGNQDTEIPLWKTKKMKNSIPHAKLRVVWGAGHSPHLEKPEEFVEILQEELPLSS